LRPAGKKALMAYANQCALWQLSAADFCASFPQAAPPARYGAVRWLPLLFAPAVELILTCAGNAPLAHLLAAPYFGFGELSSFGKQDLHL
jgi:hypothetical protein